MGDPEYQHIPQYRYICGVCRNKGHYDHQCHTLQHLAHAIQAQQAQNYNGPGNSPEIENNPGSTDFLESGSPKHSYILHMPQQFVHDHGNTAEGSTTNHKSPQRDQLDPDNNKHQMQVETDKTWANKAELLDYMYQHVQFDEIPFVNDPLYDHHQIYSHDTLYIPFGLYKNIQATVAFDIELGKEANTTYTEDISTAYMHNIGRPVIPGDYTCNNEIRKEVYNEEQNEILKMNVENTARKETSEDLYAEECSLSLQREQYEHIYSDHDESIKDKQYLLDEVNDAETFQYAAKIQEENIPMVEATYFTTEKAQKVLFDGEMYAVILYQEGSRLKAIYKNELEIPTAIDNGANVNVLPKAFYDQHPQLHELPKIKANMQPIMTGNGTIPAYFWMDLPLTIQGIEHTTTLYSMRFYSRSWTAY